MRTVREILRLKWDCKLSDMDIARSCGVARSTVFERVARAKLAGLTWPLPDDLDDEALEARVYPPPEMGTERAEIDFEEVHREMARRGVTMQLLWQEYRQRNGARGYQYTQFTVLYRAWKKNVDVVMRQCHRAGEKMFVDFAGQTLPIAQVCGGTALEAQIFVASLGTSNYTYAEALPDQTLASWVTAHAHAFEYFAGVPAVTVPDNLKSGVTKACRYEPEVNPTYMEMAAHYDTVVIPTRVRKPRDKAKVENGVLQVERWVLAPLRNQTFFSLREANAAILERLAWLNHRPLTNAQATRHSLYISIDMPALKPLPTRAFEMSTWKCNVAVNVDYHVAFDSHNYSVPYQLAGKRLDVRATASTVECLYKNNRVALHQRRHGGERYVTDPQHRPQAHQRHADWSPARLVAWGQTMGEATARVVNIMTQSPSHPEQGYRTCLGMMQLSRRYGHVRLESACARACALETYSYKSIASMLRTGMDKVPLEPPSATREPLKHSNIRGPNYYRKDHDT